MSNPTVRPALRAGCSAFGSSVRTTPIQIRAFSATSSRQLGKVIMFDKTSNKELDNVLAQVHHNIIIPHYLPTPQRRKIFRGRWKQQLEGDPVVVEIEDKKILYRHIDRTSGVVPNARKSLYRAIDNMHKHSDWLVLPKLLEGLFYVAGIRFQYSDWSKIIRKAALTGNLGVILEAIQRPQRTGLRLDASEKVQALLSGIVWEAGSEGWTVAAAQRVLRHAERVLAALGHEDHQLGPTARAELAAKGRFPLARDPQLLAVPMLAAAVLVTKHGLAEEYKDTLRKYATVVQASWPEGKGLLELHPHEAYVDPEGLEYLMNKSKFLTVAAPILRGFELAAQGLSLTDGELSRALRARIGPIQQEVTAALAAKENSSTKQAGRAMYDLCYEKLTAKELKDMRAQLEAKRAAKAEAEAATARAAAATAAAEKEAKTKTKTKKPQATKA